MVNTSLLDIECEVICHAIHNQIFSFFSLGILQFVLAVKENRCVNISEKIVVMVYIECMNMDSRSMANVSKDYFI